MSNSEDPTVVPLRSQRSGPTTTGHDVADEIDAGPLARGTALGRYVVLDELGVGAMGRVYAAYDPRLDRKVALKVIRSPQASAADGARMAARFLAEAQALARLSHPNVVGVHDVEIVDGSVVIAMEFVAGSTLRAWISTPRPWPDVLGVFIAAGSGLAAAHRAGIVHRDFKPDNVMLGDDGRARVVDFGLALYEAPASELRVASSTSGDGAMAPAVTVGIAGTPAYMAPELFGHADADARSDQFSFCVALFEALYGQRPFSATSAANLVANVLAGNIVVADNADDIPTWVHRLVVGGLAAAPEQRHPDMDTLLAALANDPRGRRRRWLGIGAATVLLAAGIGVTWQAARPSDPCVSAGAEIEALWNAEARKRVGEALRATGVSWAQAAQTEVERRLDAFTSEVVEMSRDNCLATYVRREQSEAMLDLRTSCLDARRRELAATTAAFAEADVDFAREAVRILGSLGSPEACADLEALREALAPPADATVRAAVEGLRETLAEIDVTTRAGKFGAAYPQALRVVEQAETLGYLPLVAEAKHVLGYLQDKTGDSTTAAVTLTDAALLAQLHRHDTVAASAMTDAVFVLGSQLARIDEALIWSRHADAAAGRTGDDRLVAKALNARGMVLQTRGRPVEAEQALRAGLELRLGMLGERHVDVSGSLGNLGVALEDQGRNVEAVALYSRALAIDEDLLGADHPRVGSDLVNMGTSLLGLGRREDALAAARRAESIFRAALGPDHPNLAAALGNIAAALNASGDHEGARAIAAQQLAINERRFGLGHPDVALGHHNLGAMDYELGDLDSAREHFTRAAAIYTAAYGADHPELAGSVAALGEIEQSAGRHSRAREHFNQAIAILDRPGHDARAELPIAFLSLAQSCQAQGDLVGAESAARRALALFSSQPQWAHRIAGTLWRLAQIREAAGDHPGASALAHQAIEHCTDDECADYRRQLELAVRGRGREVALVREERTEPRR